MDFNDYSDLKGYSHIYKSINYDELIHLLDGFDTGFVFIGGPWCKNCQAVVRVVNDLAVKEGLSCVYNYDPKFINVFKEEDDLRNCATLEVKLKYYELVEKIGFKSKELVVDTLIPKIHVPFFVGIRNGNCVGYYSIELLADNGILHLENDDVDQTLEFKRNILALMDKLKNDKGIII